LWSSRPTWSCSIIFARNARFRPCRSNLGSAGPQALRSLLSNSTTTAVRDLQPASAGPSQMTPWLAVPLTRPALSCPSAARKSDETHDLLASKAYFLRVAPDILEHEGLRRPSQ
jgi:hypothetical protein